MIKQVQDRTLEDMNAQLQKWGMVNVDRPCGLGKTTIFTRWVAEQKFKSVYFYETKDALRNIQSHTDSDNLILISYAKLFRLSYEEVIDFMVENEIGALVFDESHKVGARTIRDKWEPLVTYCKENNIYLIGGTGTPVRSDSVDITLDMFEGHQVFTYGICEAFDDELLREPWYVAADITDFSNAALTDEEKRTIMEADNPEDIISDALEYAGIKRDYMKFIVYYPTIKDAEMGCDYWRKCFCNLYPDFEVNVLPITSSPKTQTQSTRGLQIHRETESYRLVLVRGYDEPGCPL